eukprot:4307640-Prymnesium_polylepis.1
MLFGGADGEGEVPETPGYAAAEFAEDRARGGGSRSLQSHWLGRQAGQPGYTRIAPFSPLSVVLRFYTQDLKCSRHWPHAA